VGYTLTEMTDIIADLEHMNSAENRTLHRQLKGLCSHGLLQAFDRRGVGENAPALFDLRELCKARLFAALLDMNLEVKAFRGIEKVMSDRSDHKREPGKAYHVNGLADAIESIRDGSRCLFNLEIVTSNREARGGFVIEDGVPLNDQAIKILSAQDFATGVKVKCRLTLAVDDLLRPILEMTNR
jgi:hypothetical protein